MTRFVAAAVAASVLLSGACSGVSSVEKVTIVNDTPYPVTVEVTGKKRDGWLVLASVEAESTTTVEGVIDKGELWIFRFDYIAKHQQEMEVSRRGLEEDDWTVEVPESFEQGLREKGVPPPP
jgi:hypothetical protein